MLNEVRGRIADTDRKLLRLLDERIELGLRAERLEAGSENRSGRTSDDRVSGHYGLLSPEFVSAIFDAIVREGRRLQAARPPLAGFQGERGAWSEMASLAWDERMVPVPCRSFADVFDGVERGAFDRGVVPVENSLGGDVVDVSDLLIERDVAVIGEIVVPIRQCLLALPGSPLARLRTVYSHPQALVQCRRFIETNGLDAQPLYDTAGAARWLLFDGVRTAGVIASPLAATLYGLDVVADGVADDPGNETRFVVIARAPGPGGNKCSVVLTTEDRAGALAAALGVFAAHGINLSRIESRPTRVRAGTYAFLIDFLGEPDRANVQDALRALAAQSVSLKVLGFYEKGR
jgi:prephenate dehydratase